MDEALVNIFQMINSTNSASEKEAILRKFKNNEQLKKLLVFALSPYKSFQFHKMPCEFENELGSNYSQEEKFEFLEVLLDSLDKRHITGNEAKEAVIKTFKLFDRAHFELYAKVLTKQAIGVGISTVNKVWPGLVPEFKLMLAPNESPNIVDLKYPCYMQPKLDGYRCIYKNGIMFSRTGKSFGNNNLFNYFNKLFQVQDYVLDGELYCEGINFNKLQTILNTYDAPIPNTLKFVIYDCVPVKDWEIQNCKKPYNERIKNVGEITFAIADYSKVVEILNEEVQNSTQAAELYKNYLEKGYEGAMIKAINGLYRWKRVTLHSGEMLKLKPYKTLDLKVVGIYEGEKNFKGLAGGIIVDFNGKPVAVGSGFDVPARKEIIKSPDNFIGRTAEIKFFEETEDGSLRFPTFVRWRLDK